MPHILSFCKLDLFYAHMLVYMVCLKYDITVGKGIAKCESSHAQGFGPSTISSGILS